MAEKKISLDLEINKGGSDKTVKSIKTELREAKEEAIALARKFGELSPEATKAAAKLASLKDEMGDLNQAVNGLNPDKFQRIATLTNGVVRGFQAASGAAVLFGKTGEDIEKTIAKLQATMALADGIQGVMDARKQFVALGNQIKGSVVKAFSTLKGAIIGTGIGALVVALGLLISNFDKVKQYVLNLFPGLAKLGDYVTDLIGMFTDFIGVTTEAGRALSDSIADQQTALEKLNGWLDRNLDKYDKFTAAKFKADQDYKAKKLELDKQLNDGLNQLEYNQALKELQDQKTRAINRADQDRQIAKDELNAKIQADRDKANQDRKTAAEKRIAELNEANDLRLEILKEEQAIREKNLKDNRDANQKRLDDNIAAMVEEERLLNEANDAKLEILKEENDIREKYRQEELLKEKEYQANLKSLKLSALEATFELLYAVNQQGQDATEAQQEKAFNRNKALAIAETVISTFLSAQKAYASQLTIPSPDAPIRAQISAGIAVASGLAKVLTIKKQTFNGSSSGTSTSGSGGGSGSMGIQAPQTGFTQIRQPQNPNQPQQKTPPIKVFVVQKDIKEANTAADRITAKAVVK